MKTVPGYQLKKFPLVDLRKSRDLEYFDGPLLSEFRAPSGDTYVFYWCDCDETSNRWMVFRVSQRNIIRFESRKMSLRELILHNIQDPFVYFADISSDLDSAATSIAGIDELPPDYLPTQDSFFDPDLMPEAYEDLGTYPVLIDKGWGISELSEMPREFADTYALMYQAQERPDLKFQDLPWRGGYSAVHFYDAITLRIPFEHRPDVEAMRFESPGYIKFKAFRPVASLVAQAVKRYADKATKADREKEALAKYIRKYSLNKLDKTKRTANPIHNVFLREHGKALLELIGGIEWEWIASRVPTVFQATKIVMGYHTRVKAMAKLMKSGLIAFTYVGEANSSLERTASKYPSSSSAPPGEDTGRGKKGN